MDAIALIVPFVESWYFSEVTEGAALRIRDAGFDTVLTVLRPDAATVTEEIVGILQRPEIAGAVILDFDFTEGEAARLVATGKPLAGIGGAVPLLPTVMIDDTLAARMATNHLIAAGHKAIAHVGGALPRQMDFQVHSRRLKGYVDAMREAGLESYSQFEPAEFTIEAGMHAAGRVLADAAKRPTAIFAISDELAFGVSVASRSLGLSIPADLSLVGIDDHEMSHAFGLTTVRQNPRGMAETAVQLVLDQHRGTPIAALAGPHLQELQLMTRSTVGPPRVVDGVPYVPPAAAEPATAPRKKRRFSRR